MSQLVSFGRYRFEPVTARLWADKKEIKLTRKAAAVLGLLVARAGQPVAKEELFESVWRGAVVTDDALVTCVQELRKALGDDARRPRYIETRHRYGYRFVAKLAAEERAAEAPAPREAGLATIAVLPFTDMSAGRDQDHLCEGLAEELIDALTQIDGLRVVARSVSFRFRGEGLDVREAGRRLGVGAVLAGSVRKTDDRLRITVQLVDALTGYHTWSQRFERPLGDVFEIQDEIADAVVANLRGKALTVSERGGIKRPQTAAEAYEFYLRGRQSLHRLQASELEHSRRMFERALTLDADYAPAWAGLAAMHAVLYEWFGAKDEDLGRADAASRNALALAPDLADAHVARGFALSLHRRYTEAVPHFEAAIRINPHLFEAYYCYARASFAEGAVERSAELFGKAAAARQEDFQSAAFQAQSLTVLGRHAEARAAVREAIARAERVLALNPLDGRALSVGAIALYADGQVERAIEWSRRSLELYPDDLSALVNGACLRARMGLKEEALDLLEQVFDRGFGKRDWIEQDPDYDSLRDDPRFERMLAKLK